MSDFVCGTGGGGGPGLKEDSQDPRKEYSGPVLENIYSSDNLRISQRFKEGTKDKRNPIGQLSVGLTLKDVESAGGTNVRPRT